MTPKEKAEEIYDKYLNKIQGLEGIVWWESAKQCALIAVNEIILSSPFEPVDTDWDEAGSSAQYWYPQKLEDSGKWWGEVEEEIKKL
jgi:hypothetical protein